MAKIYLEAADSVFTVVNDNTTIIGTDDIDENVVINTGADNITIDSTIERVDFAGDIADFQFRQVFGENIEILDGAGNVIASRTSVVGLELAFNDGLVVLDYADSTISVGGTAITKTAATVDPVNIDPSQTSQADGSTGGAGQTFTLSTATTDIVSGTSGDDTVTGDATTYQNGDLITDSSSTDNDTLNVALTAASTAVPTVNGIENINFNVTSFADIEVDVDNVRGGTVTVNQLQVAGGTSADIDGVAGANDVKVVAGSGVTGTFDVTLASGGATIDAGAAITLTVAGVNAGTNDATMITANSAGTVGVGDVDSDGTTIILGKAGTSTTQIGVNIDGTTGTDDSLTLSAVGYVDLDLEVTDGQDVEKVDFSGNGAAAIFTLAGDEVIEELTVSGDQDVTIIGSAAQLTGEKLIDSSTAGTTTVKLAGAAGALDIDTDFAADVIDIAIDNGANDITVATGEALTVSIDQTSLNVVGAVASAASNTLSLIIDDGATATDDITLGAADIDNFASVAITAEADDVTMAAADFSASTDVTVSGAKKLTVTGATVAKSLNASGLNGDAAVTHVTGLTKITTGNGDDTITAGDFDITLNTGDGNDTLNVADTLDWSNNTVSLAGLETIVINSDADAAGGDKLTVDSSIVTGESFIIKGLDATGLEVLEVSMDQTSVDLSSLIVDSSTASVTVVNTGVASVDHSIIGSNGADTLSAGAATGAITISGGAGNDVITTGGGDDVISVASGTNVIVTGDGANSVTGGTGNDTVTGGAGVDTVTLGAGDDTIVSGGGNDVITAGEGSDFVVGGAGADTVDLNESTSAIDYVNFTAQGEGSAAGGTTFSGFDIVTGFAVGKDIVRFDSNVTDGTTDIDAWATALDAKHVIAQTAATSASNDLEDSEYTDVASVVSFLNDGAFTDSTSSVGGAELVAVTFSNFTALYVVDNDGTDAVAAGELELLGTVDAVLTTTELVIA